MKFSSSRPQLNHLFNHRTCSLTTTSNNICNFLRITKGLSNLVLLSGELITQIPVNNSQNDHEPWLSFHAEVYISLTAVLSRELVAHIDYEKCQRVNNIPGIIKNK